MHRNQIIKTGIVMEEKKNEIDVAEEVDVFAVEESEERTEREESEETGKREEDIARLTVEAEERGYRRAMEELVGNRDEAWSYSRTKRAQVPAGADEEEAGDFELLHYIRPSVWD